MDIIPTSILPPKSPEPELDTPTRIHPYPTKSLSLSNGFLKRHQHHHPHVPIVITYKECLKNHAAALGGHAVDGCGEFMPSPSATNADPTSLKCAACGCHRNFHRREPDDHYSPNSPPPPPTPNTVTIEYQPHHRHHPPPPPPFPPTRSPNSSSPPPISSSYYPSVPHMLLALSTGSGDITTTATPAPATNLSSPRKRFRTKFSQTQKEKMFQFAEKLGWKMQKRDEDSILEFCNEIKVDKGVLKVWMHNNKNTFGKRVLDTVINGINPTTITASITTTNVIGNSSDNGNSNSNDSDDSESENGSQRQQQQQQHQLQNQFITAASTNGASSSSS